MRRRLLNAAALLSLVLYVLTLAALGRSLWRSDQFTWLKPQDAPHEAPPAHYRWYVVVMSGRGGIELAHDAEVYEWNAGAPDNLDRPLGGWRFQGHSVGPPRYPRPAFNTRERARFGFYFKWVATPDTVRREVIVPCWFLAILTGALPTAWLVRRRRDSLRRRRAAAGLCTRCGYDLRASTVRCPECGQIVAHDPRNASRQHGHPSDAEEVGSEKGVNNRRTQPTVKPSAQRTEERSERNTGCH